MPINYEEARKVVEEGIKKGLIKPPEPKPEPAVKPKAEYRFAPEKPRRPPTKRELAGHKKRISGFDRIRIQWLENQLEGKPAGSAEARLILGEIQKIKGQS